MADKFFDENQLPNLMSRRAEYRQEIVEKYLEGVGYVDEDIGYEEACTYWPES